MNVQPQKINYYNYIHYNRENFERDINRYDSNRVSTAIRNNYKELVHSAGKRIASINSNLPSGIFILDFVEQMNNLANNISILQNVNTEELYKNLSSNQEVKDIKQINGAKKKAQQLSSFLQEVNNVMDQVRKIDSNLLKYYNQQKDTKKQQNLTNLFGSQLSILSINTSGAIAFKNLEEKINALNKTALQNTATGDKKFVNRKIQYKYTNSNGKVIIRSRNAIDEIKSISSQITNIQNSISEAMNSIYALEISNNLIDEFNQEQKSTENLKISITTHDNQKKADKIIKIATNNVNVNTKQTGINNYDVITEINIPIKTINLNKSGNKKYVKFLTTTLREIISKSDNFYNYYFLNGLALGDYSRSSKEYYYEISRYIASTQFDYAVTGQDYNVILLGFLDQIITIQDLYQSILNSQNYPRISVSGVTKVDRSAIHPEQLPVGIDENPFTKNIYAIQRSERVRNALMSLEAKILWNY